MGCGCNVLMKPVVRFDDKLLDKFSWFFTVGGISLFPYIILREIYQTPERRYAKARIITHETIHFKQALELLVIPFYVLYILEFIIRFLFKWNFVKAYKSISFEREAYDNELNESYLENRKLYSWIKYII